MQAMKYMLYMLFSGVPLLFAFIMLGVNHAMQTGGGIPLNLSFSFPVLLNTKISGDLQSIIFLLLLIGFAVKAPLVPFHTWLPTTAIEAPTQLTALLVGLKLGAFGMLRFAMPLTPTASAEYAWILGILGRDYFYLCRDDCPAANQFATATGLREYQPCRSGHRRRCIAQYARYTGRNFSIAQFHPDCKLPDADIAGFIQHRLGSTEIIHLGGLAKAMPRLTTFFFIFALASMGVPGTSGFPAELLLIIGALTAHPGLGIAALLGAILGAAYMLSFVRRAFFGPIVHVTVHQVQDLRSREFGLLCVPALLVLFFGFFPDVVMDFNKLAAESWLSRLTD